MHGENTSFDEVAKIIYNAHRQGKYDTWPAFFNLKRKDRDYWRAQAELAIRENSWPVGSREEQLGLISAASH